MKFFTIIFCGLLLSLSVAAQIGGAKQNTAVGVSEITLARDDGAGGIGELTEKFSTGDTPIHISIQLDSTASVTVRMNLVAVKAAGLKPETKSVAVKYTTDGTQNQVNFTASPSGAWAAGSYRADVYINDVLADSRAFEIEKSSVETAPKIVPAKNFVPRRRSRKN